MKPTTIFALVGTVVVLIAFALGIGNVVESVEADEIVVVQDAIDGQLHWYNQPGVVPQWFGKVTTYQKRDIYNFDATRIMFNDAGEAHLKGSIQYDMPLDDKNLTALHTRYGSPEAIKDQVVRKSVDKVIYMTGPLMSSRESYAEKRTNLINWVQDQVERGVYKVVQRQVRDVDPISGQERTLVIAEVATKDGTPDRQEDSIVAEFGIKAFNFAIEEVKYSEQVNTQIQQQQAITMAVQTAIAKSREAEQNKLTVEQQGAAEAAKAKWEQEVVKAKEVTAAQQRLEVAQLANQEAEQYRQMQLKKADGDAGYRRQVMQADGALQQKLDAYVKVNERYAAAMENYKGNWVPQIVTGSGAGGNGNGANLLIDLLTAKTAKEMGLDSTPGTAR